MLRTVFGKTIFDSRRTIIGWTLGIAAAAGLVVGLYPVIRDSPEIVDLLESYPEALLELPETVSAWTSTEDVRKYYCIFEA